MRIINIFKNDQLNNGRTQSRLQHGPKHHTKYPKYTFPLPNHTYIPLADSCDCLEYKLPGVQVLVVHACEVVGTHVVVEDVVLESVLIVVAELTCLDEESMSRVF